MRLSKFRVKTGDNIKNIINSLYHHHSDPMPRNIKCIVSPLFTCQFSAVISQLWGRPVVLQHGEDTIWIFSPFNFHVCASKFVGTYQFIVKISCHTVPRVMIKHSLSQLSLHTLLILNVYNLYSTYIRDSPTLCWVILFFHIWNIQSITHLNCTCTALPETLNQNEKIRRKDRSKKAKFGIIKMT